MHSPLYSQFYACLSLQAYSSSVRIGLTNILIEVQSIHPPVQIFAARTRLAILTKSTHTHFNFLSKYKNKVPINEILLTQVQNSAKVTRISIYPFSTKLNSSSKGSVVFYPFKFITFYRHIFNSYHTPDPNF